MRLPSARIGVLISMALLLAFPASACSEKSVSVDVDRIVTRAIAASSSVVSYQMDYRLLYHITGNIDGQPVEATMTAEISSRFDKTVREVRMDMTIVYEDLLDNGGGYNVACRQYLTGRELYTGVEMDDGEMQWTRKQLPTGFWERCELLTRQLKLLESDSLEYHGQEEVDGVACDVLEMHLDIDEVMDVYSRSSLLGDEVEFPDMNAGGTPNMTGREWIARDGSRLVKAEVEGTLHLAARDVDPSFVSGGLDMDVTGEMLYHHYNDPVSVELSPEAIART